MRASKLICFLALISSELAMAQQVPEHGTVLVNPNVAADPNTQTVQTWIQMKALRQISKEKNSDFYFFIMNAGRIKDEQSFNDIVKMTTNNGQAQAPMEGFGEFAYNAFKDFLKENVGETATKALGLVTDPILKYKEPPAGIPDGVMASPEVQMMMIQGAAKQMDTATREKFYRKVASFTGSDYDSLLAEVDKEGVLGASKRWADEYQTELLEGLSSDVKGIKTKLENISQNVNSIQNYLAEQAEQRRNADVMQKREENLKLETSHMQAIVYLGGTALQQAGFKEAPKFMAAANTAIEMNRLLKQFGPNGISPDNLLLSAGMVQSGLALASMFAAPQEDPNMKMLKAIMEELYQIRLQLYRIEGKIDRLSDTVVDGFNKLLEHQIYSENKLEDLRNLVVQANTLETARNASQTFINYVEAKNGFSRLALDCNAFIGDEDSSLTKCRKEFAMDLATNLIYADQENTPRIFNSELNNLSITNAGVYSKAVEQLITEQLSLPFYFSNNPIRFWSTISRNHEALAAANATYMGGIHPITLASPDILMRELEILLNTADAYPEFKVKEIDKQLFAQAAQRIEDIDTFFKSTVGNPAYLENLGNLLTNSMTEYGNSINEVMKQLNPPIDETAFQKFDGPGMLGCEEGKYNDYLPLPAPNGAQRSLSWFVSEPYWIAQQLGFIRLGSCYTWEPINSMNMPGNAQYLVRFHVKYFYEELNPDEPVEASSMKDGRLVYRPGRAKIIDSRYIDSASWVSTGGQSTPSAFTEAWSKTRPAYTPRDGEGGTSMPGKDSAKDRFVNYSKGEVSDETYYAAENSVKTLVMKAAFQAIKEQSGLWSEFELFRHSERTVKFFTQLPFTSQSNLADRMADYNAKFLFAKNLMLMSAYHENAANDCMVMLDSYSPENLLADIEKRMLPGNGQQVPSNNLHDNLKAFEYSCVGKSIKPKLIQYRERLNALAQ